MNYLVLSFFLILAALYPIYRHEVTRYTHCLEDCRKEWDADERLLKSSVCSDPTSRLMFHNAGTVDCEKAARRRRLTPAGCAAHRWRAESEVAVIWLRLTSSYFALLGIVLPSIFMAMYLTASAWKEGARDDKFLKHQEKVVKQLRQIQSAPVYAPAPARNVQSLPYYQDSDSDSENVDLRYY